MVLTRKNAFRLFQHIHTYQSVTRAATNTGKKMRAEFHCTFITTTRFVFTHGCCEVASVREEVTNATGAKINITMANFHLTTSGREKATPTMMMMMMMTSFFRHLIEFMMCYAWNCLGISHVTFFFRSLSLPFLVPGGKIFLLLLFAN